MDVIEFFEEIEKLKGAPRSWTVLEGISKGETIAEHSFSAALLALTLAKDRKDIDANRIVRMMLVHDLAESQVGDIMVDWKIQAHGMKSAPLGVNHGISREEKLRLEEEGYRKVAALLMNNGDEYFELWKEFETGSSPEAIFCRSIDKLDLLLQAFIYEKRHGKDLTIYFNHPKNVGKIEDRQVRDVYGEMMKRRGP